MLDIVFVTLRVYISANKQEGNKRQYSYEQILHKLFSDICPKIEIFFFTNAILSRIDIAYRTICEKKRMKWNIIVLPSSQICKNKS